ncbi:MAG: DNA-methyltransferase [Acidobacteriota bacterium]
MSSSPYFQTELGALFQADAVDWLATISPGSARLVVADPPYNIGKAEWDSFASGRQYLDWTRRWVLLANRALAGDGTMYICGFPEPLAEIAANIGSSFTSYRMLTWFYRNKANMTDDWGRSHESILHLRKSRTMVFNTDAVRIPYNRHTRKYPARTQGSTSHFGSPGRTGRSRPTWRPHPRGARPRDVLEVPTLCNGSKEKTSHPTQKPEELIRSLVLASSYPGDLVIDPFGGSGTTFAVCENSARRWLGCEREGSYCALIAERLGRPDRFRARHADESAQRRSLRRAKLRRTP